MELEEGTSNQLAKTADQKAGSRTRNLFTMPRVDWLLEPPASFFASDSPFLASGLSHSFDALIVEHISLERWQYKSYKGGYGRSRPKVQESIRAIYI